jgi:hypothetical protein
MDSALLSSDFHGWETPDIALDIVRRMGPIVFDPASNDRNPTGAQFFVSWLYGPESATDEFIESNGGTGVRRNDGKALAWDAFDGLIFCNPPYGAALSTWAQKFAKAGQWGCELITLTPMRPDTAWWQDYMATASAKCAWRGRLRFRGAPNCAPFPSVFSYWGPRTDRFIDVFKEYGEILLAYRVNNNVAF